MYFSRLKMRHDAALTGEFLKVAGGPYQIHSMIWDLFADSKERERDFLYRVDMVQGRPVVWTISAREPVYGGGVWNLETKPFEPMLSEGQRLGFSLRANPIVTKTVPASPGQPKKRYRHDVVMDAKKRFQEENGADAPLPPLAAIVQQEGSRWLSTRGDRLGLSVVDGAVRADGYRQVAFRQGRKNRNVSFSTIDFIGVLEVTDPDLFRTTLENGIGPAKGFGCGMMMIRPV